MRDTGQNRRRQARLACMLGVQYKLDGAWHAAGVIDLTETGCRLRVGEDLPPGAPVRLRFDAPIRDGARSATIEAEARVMWCRRQGLSSQAGLSFVSAPEGVREILAELHSW